MAIVNLGSEALSRRVGWFFSRFPLPQHRGARFLFELSLLLPAYFAYHLVRGAMNGRADEAFVNGARLIQIEQALGIFWELSLQALILESQLLIAFFNGVYIWGHIPVIVGLAIWIFIFRPAVFARYRNAFLISGAIGLVFFITLPVAPPRFFGEAGFVDTVTLHNSAYRVLQPPALVNQYAALPSLHFGWNLLMGLAVFETTRSWLTKGLAMFMPTLMLAGIIVTGNHYILDAVLGAVVALAALWLAGRLHRLFEGTRIHAVLV